MDGEREAQIEELNRDLLGEDDLGVVIRGHLRVEQELIRFTNAKVVDASALEDARLGYNARVHLALALGLPPTLKGPLKALGKLRNDFAHRLGRSLGKSEANKLYGALDADTKRALDHGRMETLRQLGAQGPPPAAIESSKMRCILLIVTLWAALVAENAVAT